MQDICREAKLSAGAVYRYFSSKDELIDLNGSAWRFRSGNRLRLELAQDDAPYVKASTQPSSLTLTGTTLQLPVR